MNVVLLLMDSLRNLHYRGLESVAMPPFRSYGLACLIL